MKNLKKIYKFHSNVVPVELVFTVSKGNRIDLNASKGNVLIIFSKITNEKSEKNKFHSKVVPVELIFTVSKSTAMVAMHIFKDFCRILSTKN